MRTGDTRDSGEERVLQHNDSDTSASPRPANYNNNTSLRTYHISTPLFPPGSQTNDLQKAYWSVSPFYFYVADLQA